MSSIEQYKQLLKRTKRERDEKYREYESEIGVKDRQIKLLIGQLDSKKYKLEKKRAKTRGKGCLFGFIIGVVVMGSILGIIFSLII